MVCCLKDFQRKLDVRLLSHEHVKFPSARDRRRYTNWSYLFSVDAHNFASMSVKEDPTGKTIAPRYVTYSSDNEATLLPAIRQLISKDLSEPYSIYVYRYFLHGWPALSHCVSQVASYTTHTYHSGS